MATVILGGCGETDENTIPGPNMLDEVETEVVATVSIDDDGFSEDVLDVEPGEAIEFSNAGSEAVRVTGSREDEQIYDTGEIRPDERTIIAFDTVARYSFEIDGADAEPLGVAVGLGPTAEPEETPATEAGNR